MFTFKYFFLLNFHCLTYSAMQCGNRETPNFLLLFVSWFSQKVETTPIWGWQNEEYNIPLMFGSFANTFSLWQLAYNLFVLSTGLLIPAKVSCVHEEGYKTHSWNTTFFLPTDQLFFRMSLFLYFVLLYNSAAFEKVRCENQLFFCQKKDFKNWN